MPGHVKVSSAWKDFAPKVKVSGAWKDVDTGYVRVSGVWKTWFSAGCSTQEMTVTGQSNYVLLSDATFLAFDKACPIEVTFTGTFTSTTVGGDAIIIGDLSTWAQVDIINNGTIYGAGGDGGVGESHNGAGPGAGEAGGDAVLISSANNSSILSFTNNTTMRGGGGGGGGGARIGYAYHNNDKACSFNSTQYAPSGGGGGGSGNATSVGGIGGLGWLTAAHDGGPGGNGGATTAGAGGVKGAVWRRWPTSGCNQVTEYGVEGGPGGVSAAGTAGQSGGGAGGARGMYIRGRDSCAWTNNGSVFGGFTT